MIVSQGTYDGASVMSGRCSGVQQHIRELNPQAIYIHCHVHCLNMVLVDCIKSNSAASEFFVVVQSLYTFLSTRKAHVVYVEIQKKLHPDSRIGNFKDSPIQGGHAGTYLWMPFAEPLTKYWPHWNL